MERLTYCQFEEDLELYKDMIASVSQSMFLIDRNKIIIGIFNAVPETLAGIPIETIVGKNILEYVNDPDSPLHQACSMLNSTFDPVFRTGIPLNFQYMILDSYLEATICKLPGEMILSQVRNISDIIIEQKKIEKKKHNEHSMVMMAGGLAAWSYDVQKKVFNSEPNNNVISKDMPYEKLKSRILPEYHKAMNEMFDSIIFHGCKHYHITVPVMNLDNQQQWSDVHAIPIEYDKKGNVTQIIGSQKNVTKEYEHNEKIQKLIRQNELTINNISSGIVYLNSDMEIEWENTSRVFRDTEITDLFRAESAQGYPADKPRICQTNVIRQVMETKAGAVEKLQMASGSVIECNAQPVLDDNDRIEGIVLRIDDITQKEQFIHDLAEAKERAEQSDKLKSAFLANMSHEIRTPLNSIVGFAQLIPHAENEEEQKNYIDILNFNSEVLLNLINDILDLSKIEAGYFSFHNSVFNLSSLFSEQEATFRYKMQGEIDLICDLPVKEYPVNLDRIRISQLISNFMTNAIKFTKQGYIKMGFQIEEGGFRLYVEDSGCGMNKEEVERVFHRFEKFNAFEQGTGLGTSIAQAIVKAYGGEIGVKSKPGKGSRFWAFLPNNAPAQP